MTLTGLILQALAGAIYGISYIIGNERIDRWGNSTKTWLDNTKNRIKVSYLITFFIPLLFAIYIYTIQGDKLEWYQLIAVVILFWGFISLTWTSFLLYLTKSKKIVNIFNHPRVNQVMRKSNITSVVIGAILMTAGGFLFYWQAGFVTGTDIIPIIVPIILCVLALTAYFIGFVLVIMQVIYYLFILFVNCVSMLLRPRKVVWILALILFLAGSAFLISGEIVHG